jgi:hypothetical protein
MIRLRYLTLSVLAVLVLISLVPTVLSESPDVDPGDFTVPNWVKNTAGWWASDQIPDSAFLQGIQFLIKEKIIIVKIPDVDSEVVEEVPGWVKNTAGWWAEDKIHDVTFVAAIKYLISQGIITVEQEVPEVEEPVEEVVEIKDFYMEINGGNCCVNWAYVNEEYRFEIATLDKKRGNYIDGVEINVKIISKGGELRQNLGAVTTEDGIYKSSITIPSMDWYAENILSVTGEYYGVEKTIEKEFAVFAKKGGSKGPWQVRDIVARDAETDGVNGFTELSHATGVATFTIGSGTYAIVASYADDGVQIIDISDPTAITATDTLQEGGSRELDRPWAADTFTIGSGTYAIVASYVDDGVQIIDISDPENIVAKDAQDDGDSGGFDQLDGAEDVTTFVIGSSTYAIVASARDDGVQIIDITDPTDISAKDSQDDGDSGGFDELDGASGVDTFTIGSSTYAIVASNQDDGVQIIDITDPTDISATDSMTDSGSLELDGARAVSTFTIGSSTYAIVVSYVDDGVQIIDISDPANIVAIDAETDGENGFTELDHAYNVDTFTCGSRTYAIVTAVNDGGVTLIDISNPANIVAIDAQTDEANGFTELAGARGVAMFKTGGAQYAIVTGYLDSGVQIIELPCHRS